MEIDKEISKIYGRLETLENRIVELEKLFEVQPKPLSKKLSVKEFLISKAPADDVKKTLAIGYYLEKYRDLSSFNKRDLEDGFRQAKEPVPGNINDRINSNIKKGHVMLASEKKDALKAWVLTSSGERYVEQGFEEEWKWDFS